MHNDDAMKKRNDRPATKEDLNQFPTKEDAKLFATKDDLKLFATKDDLKLFATKDDLKLFATKDDLKLFATKDDLAGFATETHTRLDSLEAAARRQALAIVKNQASIDNLDGKITSMFHTMESRNAARMDDFMANTLRVHHDNILLVHRMDTVEGRVLALERRTP